MGDVNETGWTVIDSFRENGRTYLKIQCGCGCEQIETIRADRFRKYKKMCDYQKSLIPPKHISRESYKTRLVGQTFGNLKVIGFAGYNKNKQILFECECQCKDKNKINATYSDLKSGKKDHCGCLTHERMSEVKRKYNRYDLESQEYGIGWTSNTNEEFWFDKEDYEKIKNYCWNYHKNKHGGYIEANDLENGIVKLHRVVMGETNPKVKIDHIKHNTFDNRKSQLRSSTNQENCRNHIIHSNNTSGETGVSWEKETGMWRARIFINGKGIHLGRFTDFDEAVKVRKKAEEKYFGEYSYDNSMKEGVV